MISPIFEGGLKYAIIRLYKPYDSVQFVGLAVPHAEISFALFVLLPHEFDAAVVDFRGVRLSLGPE